MKLKRSFAQFELQIRNTLIAMPQARVEFAFAKREDMRADFQALPVKFCQARAVALLEIRAALAFFERLHPEGFGDVDHAFGQTVQGGGA